MKKSYRIIKNGVTFRDDSGLIVQNANYGDLVDLTTQQASDYADFVTLVDKWQQCTASSIVSEAQTSTTATVTVDFNIYKVTGIYLATDTGKTGTNYWTGGKFSGKEITLGTTFTAATSVIVDYIGDGFNVTTTAAVSFTKTIELDSADIGNKIVALDVSAQSGSITTATKFYVDAYEGTTLLATRSYKTTAAVTSATYYFSMSEFLAADTIKIRTEAVSAVGTDYQIRVKATIHDVTNLPAGVYFGDSIISSGVNTISLQLVDSTGTDLGNSGVIQIYVATDPRGHAVAANTYLNGVAAGTDGAILEPIDDVNFWVLSEDDGDIDLALTPTDAGTPTRADLVFTGKPTAGDTIEFGAETYEWQTAATSVTTGNIFLNLGSAGDADAAADVFKAAFDANTSYCVETVVTCATVTLKASKFFVEYNSLKTTDATDTSSIIAWPGTSFGVASGTAGVTGVDPAGTSKYYLIAVLPDGRRVASDMLPYAR